MPRIKKCQFPLWGDTLPPLNELNDDRHYCSAPVKRGSSYCPDHHAVCWTDRDPDAPKVKWNYTRSDAT